MAHQVRTLTADDKTLLSIALLNAGIKARIRKFPGAFRVVFDGARETVAAALNENGFRNACGRAFDRYSFQDNQVFIRYVED